jgi:hypothetical protein
MTTPSVKTADALGAAWQVNDQAPPARLETAGPRHGRETAATAGASPRTVWSRAVRVARDLAIGLALITAIPLTVIGLAGPQLLMINAPVRERITSANALRTLRAPVDPAVTFEMAGAALHRLRPRASTDGFVVRPAAALTIPWADTRLTAAQFAELQSKWWNGPDAKQIITAAATGLSAPDRAWLAQLAKAELWQDFDLVTKAGTVDVLGQALVTPFADDVSGFRIPEPTFRHGRALAHAAVARAAHYVAIGEPEQAEQILRSVLSLGFILIDDGFGTLDGLAGRLIVDVGRDGLHQLYRTGYHPERLAGTEVAAAPLRLARADEHRVTAGDVVADAIARLNDPSLPRTVRLDEMQRLAWSRCGSVSSVLLGPSSETEQVLARARSTLSRTDAERAAIDLFERSLERGPSQEARGSLPFTVIQGAGAVASTVTGNPRIASCTNTLLGLF